MGIRGAAIALMASVCTAAGAASAPAGPDAGKVPAPVVIVPATPPAASSPQAPGRIVIVPASPGAPQGTQSPAPSAPAATAPQRIVIVPADPNSKATAPAAPASGSPQRIVIVPADPNSKAAAPAAPASGSPQRIVIVPTDPNSKAAAPSTPAPGAQPRIVIVPNTPNSNAAPAAPAATTPPRIVTVPATPGAASSQPETDTAATTSEPATTPNDEATAPGGEDEDTSVAQPEIPPSGDGMRTVTAMPDLAPVPHSALTKPSDADPLTSPAVASAAAEGTGDETDGHARLGPFLSGPGSLTFILHHTFMGAAGGFATQGIASDFHSDLGGREALLAGTLVGAGVGFGTASWWQFNHWMGQSTANYGILNSVSGGMFLTGLVDLTTDDPTALAWSSLVGAELGGWLTAGVSGGDLSLESGLLVASGEGWGAVYGAMLLAIVRYSGSTLRTESAIDALFIAQGTGAILLAFAAGHFHPSTTQILRANLSGAIVGGAVLLVSALVLGHLDSPTPYVLSMASSATTMALVSILWDAGAESPQVALGGGSSAPYRSVW